MSIFKKAAAIASSVLSVGSTVQTDVKPVEVDYIKVKVIEVDAINTPDIVIRAGEYPNKPGKRVYINPNTINIPKDIPVHVDKEGFYISEYDINKKLSIAICNKLEALGVNAKLQLAANESEDLNKAGKIAKATGAKAYLSVHHDYYDSKTEGYHFITNENEVEDAQIAQRLSDSISSGQVKQRVNRINENSYIGELNQTSDMVNILGEFGFFSNLKELQVIMSDEHIDYVSTQIAEELSIILK